MIRAHFHSVRFLILFSLFCLPLAAQPLTDQQVTQFSRLALDGIPREYPNKPSNMMQDADGVRSPREMHPAFFGSFDWHSSVHGHWMLIRLLRLYPDCSVAPEIQKQLDISLTNENIKQEVAYFREKWNSSFERMYGWAWALQLASELHQWKSVDIRAAKWSKTFKPLEDELVSLTLAYLPRLSWPIRRGTHTDTAFALGMILDYAHVVKNQDLIDLITSRAKDYYLEDSNYPVAYEPSGHDFFSAGLNEADLMRRILTPKEFSVWLNDFFPTLKNNSLGNLLTPTKVTDVTDGHLVHLAGLNFNRAWTSLGIASVLPQGNPRRITLEKSAAAHTKAGIDYTFSGHYAGEHWLATFAIYTIER